MKTNAQLQKDVMDELKWEQQRRMFMVRSMLCVVVMLGVGVASAVADKDKVDKKAVEARIIKVDAKNGTVNVKMQDDGKEVEKTFKLAENIEYIDSTGKIATVDLFTSGDMVLIVAADGQITRMTKKDKAAPTTKAELTLAMHKYLDEFDAKCKQMEVRIGKAEGQAKKDLEKTLAAAKVKRDAAAVKLHELEDASSEQWEKAKAAVEALSTT